MLDERQKFLEEKNREDAHRAHDEKREFHQKLVDASVETGKEAAKALMVINGGGCVAGLAFTGQIVSSPRITQAALEGVSLSIAYFAKGALAGALILCFGYLVNFCASSAHADRDRSFEHPYVHNNKKYDFWMRTTNILILFSILMGLMSIYFFWAGILSFQTGAGNLNVQKLPGT